MGRAFVHGEMKKACNQFRPGRALSDVVKELITLPLEPQITFVADAFVQLQDARHIADYDTSKNLARGYAWTQIALADQAFAAWEAVKDSANAKAFLAVLLLNRQWQARP